MDFTFMTTYLKDEISFFQSCLRSSTFWLHSGSKNANCITASNLNSKTSTLLKTDVMTLVTKNKTIENNSWTTQDNKTKKQ